MSASKRFWRIILPSTWSSQTQKTLSCSEFIPGPAPMDNLILSRPLNFNSRPSLQHRLSCPTPFTVKHKFGLNRTFGLQNPHVARSFCSPSSLPPAAVAASAMSAPAYSRQCAVSLGWEGDSPASPGSLPPEFTDTFAFGLLTYSDSSSPSIQSSDTPVSQPPDATLSFRIEDALTDNFRLQWSYHAIESVMDTCEIMDYTSISPSEFPDVEEISTLPGACNSATNPNFSTSCSPPSFLPDSQQYPIPIIGDLMPSDTQMPTFHQDSQFVDHPLSPSAVHVSPTSATCSPRWTSRAFPRSSRVDDSPSRMKLNLILSSPRARYFTRSFLPCSLPLGRSPLACRLSSHKFSTTSSLKRKDDVSCLPPTRSQLRPPKPAPSVWQIFFTDWLERKKQDGSAKLNVAQAAKEAGRQYSNITNEQREELKRRAAVLKAEYERECAAWKRMLRPDDIARENAFRAAQRKSGKSRRKNLSDPNAPKRPLSAYFLFLQRIRGDPTMVKEIFGDDTETTRQSVLAAARWRNMAETEKRPYFQQAEIAKLEYEAELKAYLDQVRENEYSTLPSVIVYPSSGHHGGNSESDGIQYYRTVDQHGLPC